MKRWFSALPIHRKLTTLALGVSTAALLAAVLGLVLFDVARFRRSSVDEAYALAEVIAENTAAAIVFDDEPAARSTLASVRVRPTVRVACVYRADGSLLASYVRSTASACPVVPMDAQSWSAVRSVADVRQNGRHVGSVLVERDLSDLPARVMATAGAGVFMLLVGGAIALGLARALQRLVSRPIVALAQAARAVGRDPQFILPDIKAAPDETGELVRAFGDMVRRIGETNAALVETNLALSTEVAQRRRMEHEREALLAREREASRLKDEFLAALSHELRTPLNAILGWVQILQSTNPSEDTRERALASLARNAQAQQRVIEDLLDISRIITGKLRLSTTQMDLRDAIDGAIDVVGSMAASRTIHLEVDLPATPCLVQGDSDRLRQVLWNLLSNALKFTPPGGQVRVRLVEHAKGFAILVSDTGIGIDPAFLGHVFERFRQADGSTTREQGGLGLGLAIVKELTELHGGTVAVESEGRGRGSTFTVRLPRSMPVAQRDRPGPSAASTSTALRLDRVSVLVVDDNEDSLDVIGLALEQAGAVVRKERSGVAAVAAWTAAPATVLVCDLAMPGMDGFDVLRRIRAIDADAGRTTHALAVTAYASEDFRVRCLQAGFAGHLSKPCNMTDVIRAVAAAAAHA
jgi:signal transduction histidine kinase/ActR/RegA family two-component response regulator